MALAIRPRHWDWAMRLAIMIGARILFRSWAMPPATRQMKFVFHRNSHIRFLCPFPVIWAIADEAFLAQEMFRMIEKQFAGKRISSPLLLPHRFTIGPCISEGDRRSRRTLLYLR